MFENKPNSEIRLGSDKSFGLVFGAVFGLVGLYLLVKSSTFAWAAAVVALGFFAVAYIKPALLHRPNRLWFKFGLGLHSIVSPVVMFLVFILAFVPTGIFMKLRGHDPLAREFDPSCDSYWKTREKAPESMNRQY
ncbi:MAG: SxtJ family membrane protein [Bacteroidota bacterium]